MTENERQHWLSIAQKLVDVAAPQIEQEIAQLKNVYDHTMTSIESWPDSGDRLRMIQLCLTITNKMSEAGDKLRGYLELADYLEGSNAADLTLEDVVMRFSNAA